MPEQTKVLAFGYLFSGVLSHDRQTATDYYGVKHPAIFLEVKPFRNAESGKVITFGSVSYGLMLDLNDKTSHKVFENTVNFLMKK